MGVKDARPRVLVAVAVSVCAGLAVFVGKLSPEASWLR